MSRVQKMDKLNLETFSTKQSVEKEYNVSGLTNVENLLIKKYFKKKGKILDIGCGAGRTTVPLAKMGYDVVGIDYSKKMIGFAKKKYPNILFNVMNASELKYKESTFDYILFSFNGLDCIASESKRFQCIKEMRRVLKKGGILLFSTHNPFKLPLNSWKMKVLIENTLRGNIFRKYWIEHSPFGTVYLYYKDVFKQKKDIEKLGLKILEIRGKKYHSKWKIRLFENAAHFALNKE